MFSNGVGNLMFPFQIYMEGIMLLRLIVLTVTATFCTADLFASMATAITDQGFGSDIPPIMVQLDLVYGENEEPATIFVPFGKTGTLDTAEYNLAITPRLQEGKHEIGLDIDVSESDADTRSGSAQIRSNYTLAVEN